MAEIREIEKGYNRQEAAAKIRRLAEALEQGKAFEIQVAGKRVYVPPTAEIVFEYEYGGPENELEIEITWKASN